MEQENEQRNLVADIYNVVATEKNAAVRISALLAALAIEMSYQSEHEPDCEECIQNLVDSYKGKIEEIRKIAQSK